MTENKRRRLERRRRWVINRNSKIQRRASAKKARRRVWTQWRQAKRAQIRDRSRHPFYRRGLSSWVKRMLGLDKPSSSLR